MAKNCRVPNASEFKHFQGGADKCLELTSPKSVREKRSMASEREWLLLTAEMYSREDALKAEKDLPINLYYSL